MKSKHTISGNDWLKLKNVQVLRGGQSVLQNLNLNLKKGENLLVIGDNGAGKTTFLQLLSGLVVPESGSFNVEGKTLNASSHRKFQKKIAYIPQDLGLIDESSVERNILLGILDDLNFTQTLLGMFPKSASIKAKKIMNTLGIAHLCDRKTKNISGGERKKVAIARAFMRSPELLLIDEMLSDLAPKAAQKILDDLAIMQKDHGFSTVFVEHHISNVLEVSDWLVTLEHGQFTNHIPKSEMESFVHEYFFASA